MAIQHQVTFVLESISAEIDNICELMKPIILLAANLSSINWSNVDCNVINCYLGNVCVLFQELGGNIVAVLLL